VWDDTKVLDAKLGDYVLIARRHGKDWYVGAMTDWTPRELEVDCSFLPDGNFKMQSYQDGANADRHGADYKMTKSQVTKASKLKVKLAEGGGWAAKISP
jgi:alpha-glucosidase